MEHYSIKYSSKGKEYAHGESDRNRMIKTISIKPT